MGMFNLDEFVEETKKAYETSKVPMLLLDETLKLIYYNRSANNLYRMLCIGESLSRYLTADDQREIKERIKEKGIYSFKFKDSSLFDCFLFTKLDAPSGKSFVRLQVEEKYSVRNVFENLSLESRLSAVISEQLLAPLSQMQVAVDLLSKKIYDEGLVEYLEYFKGGIYELSKSTYRIAEIFRAFSDYGKFEVEYFDPVDTVKEIAKRLDIDCEIVPGVKKSMAFASKDAFATVITSAYVFISSYKMIATKAHKVETEVSEDNGFTVIKIFRGGLDADDKREKRIFDFDFTSDGRLEDTLVIAREIINSAGGSIFVEAGKGKIYKKVTVTIRIPAMEYGCYELSSEGEITSSLNPYFAPIFETLKNKLHE